MAFVLGGGMTLLHTMLQVVLCDVVVQIVAVPRSFYQLALKSSPPPGRLTP
jgi:hypothetical protein